MTKLKYVPVAFLACLSVFCQAAAGAKNFLKIWSGVHVEEGKNLIVNSQQQGRAVLLGIQPNAEGTLGGCKPGSGSRGTFIFKGDGIGGVAEGFGQMYVRVGNGPWTFEVSASGSEALEFGCEDSLP